MSNHISRRSFLVSLAAGPLIVRAVRGGTIPVGLELFSVREELRQDVMGTVRAVAQVGYEGVEFFSPYFEWTADYARQVRSLLDELKIKCFSTHNSHLSFEPENVDKAIELNQILGSKFIVMASAGRVDSLDGWKKVADRLNEGAARMKPAGLGAGFHNHQTEFRPIEGKIPMEVLAERTTSDVTLQLDVGTCLEAGADPVAWIESNPGRVRSIHCKEWSPDPDKGYRVLFGEGTAPWKRIFEAAEKTGGVEHYLIEQEGSAFPPMETVKRCLAAFRSIRA